MTPGPSGRFHHPLMNDPKALKYCSGFEARLLRRNHWSTYATTYLTQGEVRMTVSVSDLVPGTELSGG